MTEVSMKSRELARLSFFAFILILVGIGLEGSIGHALPLAQAAILFLFLPGIIQGKTRTHFWLGCLLMLYFVKAVIDMLDSPASLLAIAQIICCLVLFGSALDYVKKEKPRIKRAQKTD